MPGILCEHCTAVCCNYIALPIDIPETTAEYEDLRWFLLHERVSVFVEDGDWYIAFQTPCRHLQPDYRCGIYATRPQICRKYTTDNCDYHSGDYGWQHHFTCAEHLDEYRRTRGDLAPAAQNGRARRTAARNAGPRRRVKGRVYDLRRPQANAARPGTAAPPVDRHGIPLPLLPFD